MNAEQKKNATTKNTKQKLNESEGEREKKQQRRRHCERTTDSADRERNTRRWISYLSVCLFVHYEWRERARAAKN